MFFLGSLHSEHSFYSNLIDVKILNLRIRTCGIAPVDSPIGANSIVLTLMTLVTVSRAVKIKLENSFNFAV